MTIETLQHDWRHDKHRRFIINMEPDGKITNIKEVPAVKETGYYSELISLHPEFKEFFEQYYNDEYSKNHTAKLFIDNMGNVQRLLDAKKSDGTPRFTLDEVFSLAAVEFIASEAYIEHCLSSSESASSVDIFSDYVH